MRSLQTAVRALMSPQVTDGIERAGASTEARERGTPHRLPCDAYALHTGSQPLSMYSAATWAMCFPHLFPYGDGVFGYPYTFPDHLSDGITNMLNRIAILCISVFKYLNLAPLKHIQHMFRKCAIQNTQSHQVQTLSLTSVLYIFPQAKAIVACELLRETFPLNAQQKHYCQVSLC